MVTVAARSAVAMTTSTEQQMLLTEAMAIASHVVVISKHLMLLSRCLVEQVRCLFTAGSYETCSCLSYT